jgi:hypothetical protein
MDFPPMSKGSTEGNDLPWRLTFALIPGDRSMTIALLQPTMGVLFVGVWVLVAHIVVGDRRA